MRPGEVLLVALPRMEWLLENEVAFIRPARWPFHGSVVTTPSGARIKVKAGPQTVTEMIRQAKANPPTL